MDNNLQPYVYRPLLFQKSPDGFFDIFTIRVLVLQHAANRSSPLVGHLEHVELGTSERAIYEPVSYVWGDSTLIHVLICEDQELRITTSADTVLRRFRHSDKPRRLWIDAICINQKDNDEKMRQVQHMAQIYSSSSEGTQAWLGDAVDHRCIDFLWGLSSTKWEHCTTAKDVDGALRHEMQRFFGSTDLTPVHDFLRIPWFTRRWIIQEAALSPESSCRLYCNDSDITWHALSHALLLLSRSSFRFDDKIIEQLRLSDNFTRELNDSWSILDCLVGFHIAQCQDGRDRIYSLLGLADDVARERRKKENSPKARQSLLKIVPDYRLSTIDVYRSFAENLLLNADHLDILQCAGAFPTPERSGLPSWIPDWTQKMQYRPLINVPWFNAGPRKPSSEGSVASSCYPWCMVRGVVAGKILFIFEEWENFDKTLPAAKYLEQFIWLPRRLPLVQRGHTGERFWQVAAQVLIADHALNHRLRTRFANPKGGWCDGRRMKRDARDRDTQVFMDWFQSAGEDPAIWRNCKVKCSFREENFHLVLEKRSHLLPTLHQTIFSSAYIKLGATEGDWHESSSARRSAWHELIDADDGPYMIAQLMQQGLDSAQKEKPQTSGHRTSGVTDFGSESEDGSPAHDTDTDEMAITNDLLKAIIRQLLPEDGDADTSVDSSLVSPQIQKDNSRLEGYTMPSQSLNSQNTDDPITKRAWNSRPGDRQAAQREKILARHDEELAQMRDREDQLKALIAQDNVDEFTELLDEILHEALGSLARTTRDIFGHVPTTDDLRLSGLDGMAELLAEKPELFEDSETDNVSSEDEMESFFTTDRLTGQSQIDEPDIIEPGEYARVAAVGDLRHGNNYDEMIWFPPDQQNTERYSELVWRTMSGRRIFLMDNGFMGIVPAAAKVGDTIAAFRGGRVPFVIRPHKSGDASWELIGDCYVHGIMRGEIFHGENIQERDFVLK
ncbi:HET-domain-containing protein [Stipitochalara longipes BDJ]|nr:HET-domain-containing protein [Stipitochalara longipes BDJ]